MELRIDGIAKGGAGVGRTEEGFVVFVPGALPGETVDVDLADERSTFAHGRLRAVIDAVPQRQLPPCPFVASGCGGCDFQHATLATQSALKVSIVSDALERVGRLTDLPPIRLRTLPGEAYRTTVRLGVVGSGLGYRQRASKTLVEVDACLVLHPGLDDLVATGSFRGAREVTLRIGARTGERLVLVEGQTTMVQVPEDVRVVARHELKRGQRAWYHEEAAGRRWRISAESFFQARADGADALVEEVVTAVGTRSGLLADLYGGVGLFAGVLGGDGPVVLVEHARSSVADAKHNLADLDVKVVRCAVERWKAATCDVVVADPARKGLGREGVATVVATGAATVVLVSCDPASFGRDAQLLSAAGYRLEDCVVVDLFGHTTHIETVATFRLR